MGRATLTPMVADDHSLSNALITITTFALTHFLIAWLKQVCRPLGELFDCKSSEERVVYKKLNSTGR